MTNALKNYAANQNAARNSTAQTVAARPDQVVNNAGGFVFEVADKDRLERFLILGTDKGTYYVNETKLTDQNVDFVKKLIKSNERLVVDTIVDVSSNNRAAKQSPAIFALALVFTEGSDKAYAREAMGKVVRTSTHLFEFAEYINSLGGWGRAKRSAVAEWYTSKDADRLSYQAVKYRQRNGWTHRDLFRLSHPTGVDSRVGDFILGKDVKFEDGLISGFQRMQGAGTVKEVIAVLDQFKDLPWEAIPTQFLTSADVWKKLFYNGAIGQTALIRNVTRLAKNGAFEDMVFKGDYAKALSSETNIAKGRVHPIQYANAMGVYEHGPNSTGWSGYRNSVDWKVDAKILGALEAGFYAAFKSVEPANKATYLALDVSGSMTAYAPAGLVGMNCMDAAAVMAMVTLRTEPYVEINGFSGGIKRLNISDTDSLATVRQKLSRLSFSTTDCSLPMKDAAQRGINVDTFVVYTDNETYAGTPHPFQALKQYSSKFNSEARLAVVGMASTNFTIADPSDRGMMDFVGMDSNAPKVLADFSAGRI